MSSDIAKRPMAPAIVSSHKPVARQKVDTQLLADRPETLVESGAQQKLAVLRELKAKLLENSEDVGGRFAEEARNIHFGDAEQRPIHGEASIEDARQLDEDGIPFGVLPQLPEDKN